MPTPSPCTLLIRDRALVANLESVRMIICSNAVFVLSVPKASDARVAAFPTLDNPFIKQLCKCLRTGKSTATLHDLNRCGARRGTKQGGCKPARSRVHACVPGGVKAADTLAAAACAGTARLPLILTRLTS